jgi:Phage capsid family
MPKTISEHLTALEAKRSSLEARMNEIMAKAMDEGRSTDESEKDEFDGLEREREAIDSDLVRFRRLEKSNLEAAKPVVAKTVEDGAAERGNDPRPYVRVSPPALPPGIRFARIARCLAMAQGNRGEAANIAETQYGADQEVTAVLKAGARFGEVSDLAVKAAVGAAVSGESQWAGSLVSAAAGEAGAVGDFLSFLRPQTILGKFGTNGIPGLRRVPFRTGLISQVSGGAAYWVGESAAKPLTRFDLSRRTLTPLKVANIAVATDELIRDSSPSADGLIRDTLAAALRERLDIDFIDPANAGTAEQKPASITNGAPLVMSTGAGGAGTGTAVQVRNDVRALLGQFQAANNDLAGGVWIMRPTTAMNLSMMVNALGAPDPLVTDMTMDGGRFMGMPVIISQYVPVTGSPIGDFVVLVDANSVWLADEGGLTIDMSREASLEMSDTPTMTAGAPGLSPNAPVAATGAIVSLWQVNCVGFRVERTINWAVARPNAVAVLTGGNWGE